MPDPETCRRSADIRASAVSRLSKSRKCKSYQKTKYWNFVEKYPTYDTGEKNQGKTFSVLNNQILSSINKSFNLKKILIAYEPIWSIGTGKISKNYDLIKIFKFIKENFKKKFRTRKFPIVLYGGSVNEKNIRNFSTISDIDGFLIGGASQSSKKFIDIIKNYYK